MLVMACKDFVCVKIVGRANFTYGPDFKTLLTELVRKGCDHFIIDLSECVLMDSTFLGILAGFGLKLNKAGAPDNRGIERNWSPLWSLWRWERSAKTGAASQSFLWNLYRNDTTVGAKKCSLLFGLFQYQSDGENKRLRLFYIRVVKTGQPAGQSVK